MDNIRKYKKSKTTNFFRKLCKIVYFCLSVNFWIEELNIPLLFRKIYKQVAQIANIASYFFIAFEWGAFYSQHHLTEKQKSDRFLMSYSHTILYSYCVILIKNKRRIKKLMYILSVELKEHFNNKEVERQMIKKTKYALCALIAVCYSALVFYGVDALIQSADSGKTFVTLITYWPDIDDKSSEAGITRLLIYIFWWFVMARVFAVYILVLPITVCLSHQYINLQIYFKNLSDIFQLNVSQREKEEKYEKALKIGIKLHSTTIWCAQEVQSTCSQVFSGQILVNIAVIALLMSQMMNSERTMANTFPIIATLVSMLLSTGLVMWNAGDVTVEASHLPTAIFLSGWQHCRNRASYRVRRLLLIAITQSQKPVILQSLGIIELSYRSYLSIVKTSYSIFSVLY